ncbi:Cytochrome P450 [Corchorus olitorius]|uniref:Cytochrome P450 n=1 Tax=Corchorus olitorius TaxID=93759 RepID=A0A1R3HX54_9ROSI|nr:Cytochrome P450 [Corchorus olitorius]
MDIDFLSPYLNSKIAGVFVILLSSFLLIRWSRKSLKGQKPPEAAGGWPVFGHLHVLAGSQLPYLALGALADKYGPIFAIRIGLHPAVVVSSSELAKEIFTNYDVLVSSRPKLAVGELLGHNYANFGFCPYGAYWREMRKVTAAELMSNRRLELMKHVRASEVEISTKELYKLWSKRKSESSHALVEVKQWFGDLNLNVILRMVAGKRFFGVGVVNEEEEARRCRKAMREFFHLGGLFLVRDAIPFLGWLDLGGHEKAMKKTAKELDSIMEQWLEEHRNNKKEKSDQDFLDVLLSVLEGIDLEGYDVDTVTKATALTLLVGGTDTVTVTITWALALLLNNRHALEKAQEELDIQIGKGRLVNESDIEKLVYLQAIVKETLRLYPAGPLGGARVFSEDCKVGGYLVPKGTRLIVNIWKIQTDPHLWSRSAAQSKNHAPQAAGAWPIIGHLPLFGGPKLPHITLGDMAEKYGPIYGIKLGVHPGLVVSSWEIAKEIITNHDVDVTSRPKLTAFKHLGFDYTMFGFSPYGPYWREMRKIVNSELLSNQRLEQFKHVRVSELETSLKELYKLCADQNGSSFVAMEKWFGDLLLNILFRMVTGKRYFGAAASEGHGKEAGKCQVVFRNFFRLLGVFLWKDTVPFLGFLDLFGGQEKAMKETAKDMNSIATDWLNEHKQKRLSNILPSGELKHQDFVDVLISIVEAESRNPNLSGFDADTIIKATSVIQTDPLVWSDPYEFKPERFLTSDKLDMDVRGQHFELIPFGCGRRICPGTSFGLQMLNLTLAGLLQAFEVSTPSNEKVDMTGSAGLTNMKATPLEVVISPRLSPIVYDI